MSCVAGPVTSNQPTADYANVNNEFLKSPTLTLASQILLSSAIIFAAGLFGPLKQQQIRNKPRCHLRETFLSQATLFHTIMLINRIWISKLIKTNTLLKLFQSADQIKWKTRFIFSMTRFTWVSRTRCHRRSLIYFRFNHFRQPD